MCVYPSAGGARRVSDEKLNASRQGSTWPAAGAAASKVPVCLGRISRALSGSLTPLNSPAGNLCTIGRCTSGDGPHEKKSGAATLKVGPIGEQFGEINNLCPQTRSARFSVFSFRRLELNPSRIARTFVVQVKDGIPTLLSFRSVGGLDDTLWLCPSP